MTAATSPPRRPEGNRSARATRLFRDTAVRRQLDNALTAIGACALVTAALRITDLIDPNLLGGIHL